MAFDDATTPLLPGDAAAPARFAQSPLPSLDLRPLSTGELLDRVFFLYRSRLLVFMTIALVPTAISFVGQLLGYLLRPHVAPGTGTSVLVVYTNAVSSLGPSLVTSFLVLFGYALAQAATTRVVSQLYLEGQALPGAALKASLPHLWRYVGIELWKVWSAMWLPIAAATVVLIPIALAPRLAVPLGIVGFCVAALSLVYSVIAYIRNSLGIPASVVEALPVRQAMRRSKQLVAGRKVRIFLLYLLLMLLYLVALGIQSPFLILLTHTKAPTQQAVAMALELGVATLISLFLTPIASIALCLFYFDERVRREGFDIDFLLRGPAAAGRGLASPSAPLSDPQFESPQAGSV
jgi:hypothetical protein